MPDLMENPQSTTTSVRSMPALAGAYANPNRILPQLIPVGVSAVILLGIIPGLYAFIFGYFTFRSRVRGVYFSIITQATTLAATLVFRKNEMRLCGTNGLTNFVTLAGYDLQKSSVKLGLYFVTALVLLGVY